MSTGIEWTDETWNPIRGCSRVSEGCRNCYAERVATRFSGPGQPYEGLVTVPSRHSESGAATTGTRGKWNGTIRVVQDKLTEPLRWKRPRRVFVNSMSDLFHEGVAERTMDRIFAVMAQARRHTFQILTKRPERMREQVTRLAPQHTARDGSGWPLPNVWLGVSVEDQATADARIPLLLQTPAAVRFISAEPLLWPVNLQPFLPWEFDTYAGDTRLDWVIVGGESGQGARPCSVVDVHDLVAQCVGAGVPVFVKQLGARPVLPDGATLEGWPQHVAFRKTAVGHAVELRSSKGGDMAEWVGPLQVRQFPAVAA